MAFWLSIPLLVYLFWGLKAIMALKGRATQSKNGKYKDFEPKKIQLLLAFRNAIHELPSLLQSLKNQTYTGNWELLMADDGSTDGSAEYLVQNAAKLPLKLLKLPAQGKKAAIQQLVKASDGDILIFTDADCQLPSNWISSMTLPFKNPQIEMVLGPVVYNHSPQRWNAWFTLDFLALVRATQAGVYLKKPFMANGANMAVRTSTRKNLSEQDLNLQLLSGDDVFVLHAILKQFGPNALYFEDEALVLTNAPKSWKAFINQRIRWGSKAKYYQNNMAQYTSLLVFTANLSILLLCLIPGPWLLLWPLKALIDYLIIAPGAQQWKRADAKPHYLSLALVYPFYLVATALLAIIRTQKTQSWN